MKIKKTHRITKLDECDIGIRMRTDRQYYHCVGCSNIFEDKRMNLRIVNLRELNGQCFIPSVFRHYRISSGYCDPCYISALEDLNKRRRR